MEEDLVGTISSFAKLKTIKITSMLDQVKAITLTSAAIAELMSANANCKPICRRIARAAKLDPEVLALFDEILNEWGEPVRDGAAATTSTSTNG